MENLGNKNFNSNKPNENLNWENEFLQLKLKAETGAETFFEENIPPNIKNIFLKKIFEFEQSPKSSFNTIIDMLNQPVLPNEKELNDFAIEIAFKDLLKMLEQKHIAIVFLGEYDFRTKYKFITEELFVEEVPDSVSEGMIYTFLYEDFHPNHTLEIERVTHLFISDWMKKSIDKNHPYLSETITSPTGKVWHKDEIASKLKNNFEKFKDLKNYHYSLDNINLNITNELGMAFAEGYIKYTAILNTNEKVILEGPFKLYLNLEYDWWSIFYFVFPGYE